jgi:hypothetical protein
MPKVTYTQMWQRSVEIEVTSYEYNLLHQTLDMKAREDVEHKITDQAVVKIEGEPLELIMADCTDENDEEIFDVDL